MKKTYKAPEIDITVLGSEGILTDSAQETGGEDEDGF